MIMLTENSHQHSQWWHTNAMDIDTNMMEWILKFVSCVYFQLVIFVPKVQLCTWVGMTWDQKQTLDKTCVANNNN